MRATVIKRGAILILAMGLSACNAWTPAFTDVAPLVGPAPYGNRTPMNAALQCLKASAQATPDLRIGVADFVDGSGASMGDGDVNGRYFSQRPDLMLIVAFAKTGVRLVNRTSTAVAEWEMRQAMDRRLGDGKPVVVGRTRFDYRPVRAGEFLGSTFYANGAITEINWALSSNVEEAGFLGATVGRRTYRVSIATDIVVTNSLTTEVVFARSYSKQLVGNETGAGVFRFVEATIMPKSRVELFQANIGQKQNEPVQQALRWLIELASFEVISALTGGDQNCDALIPGYNGDDPPIYPTGAPPVSAQVRPRTNAVPLVGPPLGVPRLEPAGSPARTPRVAPQYDGTRRPPALPDEVAGRTSAQRSPGLPGQTSPEVRDVVAADRPLLGGASKNNYNNLKAGGRQGVGAGVQTSPFVVPPPLGIRGQRLTSRSRPAMSLAATGPNADEFFGAVDHADAAVAGVFDSRSTRGTPGEQAARVSGSTTGAAAWISAQAMLSKSTTDVALSASANER